MRRGIRVGVDWRCGGGARILRVRTCGGGGGQALAGTGEGLKRLTRRAAELRGEGGVGCSARPSGKGCRMCMSRRPTSRSRGPCAVCWPMWMETEKEQAYHVVGARPSTGVGEGDEDASPKPRKERAAGEGGVGEVHRMSVAPSMFMMTKVPSWEAWMCAS